MGGFNFFTPMNYRLGPCVGCGKPINRAQHYYCADCEKKPKLTEDTHK
jgi:predicted amidophosphoribosyltransferase